MPLSLVSDTKLYLVCVTKYIDHSLIELINIRKWGELFNTTSTK